MFKSSVTLVNSQLVSLPKAGFFKMFISLYNILFVSQILQCPQLAVLNTSTLDSTYTRFPALGTRVSKVTVIAVFFLLLIGSALSNVVRGFEPISVQQTQHLNKQAQSFYRHSNDPLPPTTLPSNEQVHMVSVMRLGSISAALSNPVFVPPREESLSGRSAGSFS